MNGHSITESDPSPRLRKDASIMDTQPIRLLKHNSSIVNSELALPKVDQELPLFDNVEFPFTQKSFFRMDSQPSYARDITPTANSDYGFFDDYLNTGPSPKNFKFVDEPNGSKVQQDTTPTLAFSTPKAANDHKSQNNGQPAGSPSSNLRKRKPCEVDKLENAQIKKKESPIKETTKTQETEEDSEDELEAFDAELPPNQQRMLCLLVRMLKHDTIEESDLEDLTAIDLEVVRSIVKRKYGVNINPKDFDDKKKLLAELNSLDAKQKGQKRSEENNKLVFKRAVKRLISKYKADNQDRVKDMKKKDYETLIVRYYFGGIPLPEVKKRADKDKGTEVKDKSPRPLSSGPKGDEKIRRFVINPNTINAKYIRFVFKSPAFKDFFDDFVANHFIADYKRQRPNKIRKILDAVYSNLSQKKPTQLHIQNAKAYIEKNPKFKLPWSDKELEACIKSTNEFIVRVFRDRSNKRKRH